MLRLPRLEWCFEYIEYRYLSTRAIRAQVSMYTSTRAVAINLFNHFEYRYSFRFILRAEVPGLADKGTLSFSSLAVYLL